MIQDIIVYVIIALTLTYVVFSVIVNLRVKKENHCGGCDGCSVKNELKKSTESKRSLLDVKI
jgi:ammonia channel protein AmtB